MKTTPLYRVISLNETIMETYITEEAALYELRSNPKACRVECARTRRVLGVKETPLDHWEMIVVYSSPIGEDIRESWVTCARLEKVWDAARRRAPLNYLVDHIHLYTGEIYTQ